MRKADREDKSKVIEIISAAYLSNPSILWILKNDSKVKQRIKILASYCFELGIAKNGLHISNDGYGLCIVYQLNNKKSSFRLFMQTIRLALFGITIFRLPEILNRKKMVEKIRSTNQGWYGMLFATHPEHHSLKTALEIQRFVYEMADQSNLTIYAETTVEKNKKVYEKFGFEVFDEWISPKRGLKTYFIRRNVGKNKLNK